MKWMSRARMICRKGLLRAASSVHSSGHVGPLNQHQKLMNIVGWESERQTMWRTSRQILCAMLIVLSVGANGCQCSSKKTQRTMAQLMTLTAPKCHREEDCQGGVIDCKAGEEPRCSPRGALVGDDHRFCFCEPPWPKRDGGVVVKEDGGTP